MSQPLVTLSVVSHGQADLVHALLQDVVAHAPHPIELIVTSNIPEKLPFDENTFGHPTRILRNHTRKGFGANHNAAFRRASGSYFCVVNPDIRIRRDPFAALMASLQDPRVGVAGPLVRSATGEVETSFRRFPTPLFILRKALLGSPSGTDYPYENGPVSPDWIGGMFMMFRRETYAEIGGFDERYFLYYEDVDICARLRRAGYDVRVEPGAEVVHSARRDSHRRPLFLAWHLRSMLRFWMSDGYRRRR